MLLVQKKRRKQDDPEETYVLVAGFVDLHDINQNVHLSGGSSVVYGFELKPLNLSGNIISEGLLHHRHWE